MTWNYKTIIKMISITLIGNFGPGYNLVGPSMNFAGFSSFGKLSAAFLMICGKLEIYTVAMLFSKSFWGLGRAR